jgi:murein DD-endopeptidase MepM/ murein hydrolase activator NlpD
LGLVVKLKSRRCWLALVPVGVSLNLLLPLLAFSAGSPTPDSPLPSAQGLDASAALEPPAAAGADETLISPVEQNQQQQRLENVRVNLHTRDSFRQACAIGAISAQDCSTAISPTGAAGSANQRLQNPNGTLLGDSGLSAAAGFLPPPSTNPISVAVEYLGRQLVPTLNVAGYLSRTPRPAALVGNGDRQLLFPLSIQAAISSAFGWRTHPIFGDTRMHTGTDLSAPQGTPVVAVHSGTVAIADFLGGYGLTVVLDHEKPRLQTLYGHLSELYVKPGSRVRQGEVIGRVGSTGNSTGPHLHFEVRQPSAGGWVAVNPGNYLGSSMTGLMAALQGKPAAPSALPANGLTQLLAQLYQALQKPAVAKPAAKNDVAATVRG